MAYWDGILTANEQRQVDNHLVAIKEVERVVDKHQEILENHLVKIQSAVAEAKKKRELSIGSCGTCAFREGGPMSVIWKCDNPMYRVPDYNAVTGETIYRGEKPYCHHARSEGSLCGPSGVLYEDQHPLKPVVRWINNPNTLIFAGCMIFMMGMMIL